MTQELSHPQVTPEQIDLWLANPVTEAYFKCLGWFREDVRDEASNGAIVDSSSADLTHAMIHQNMGQQQALISASDHANLFSKYNMVLVADEGEEDAGN